MNLKYTPAKVKSPKNKWIVTLNWMSGDADHDEKVDYSFKTEEACIAFLKKVKFIVDNELGSFRAKNYNVQISTLRDKVRTAPELEGYVNLRELFFALFTEDMPRDITVDHQFYASLDSIAGIVKYDENGVKFDAEIS